MPSVLDSLLFGIVAALVADAQFAALCGDRVYDTVAPEGTMSPYVVINGPTEVDDSMVNRRGNRTTFHLNIWYRDAASGSQEISSRVVNAVYKRVEAVLNLQPMLIAGSTLAFGTCSFVVGMLDPDLQTYHGVARYDARTRS